MRALRVRLLALLTVLTVLLPGGALARSEYFCRAMGRVMDSCCCPAKKARLSAGVATEVRPAGCCEWRKHAGSAAAPATRHAALEVFPAALVATLPAVTGSAVNLTLTHEATPRQARAPPALGPPLFLKHCVLLT